MKKIDDAKTRIIKVAIEEFVNKGFDGTSISTITKKANTNKAMVNYYFGNKNNLYKEALNYTMNRVGYETRDNPIKTELKNLSIDQVVYYDIYFHLSYVLVDKYESINAKFFTREILKQGENLEALSQKVILSKFEDLLGKVEEGIKQKIFKYSNYKYLLFNIMMNVMFFDYGPILFGNTKYANELFAEEAVKNNFRYFILDLFFKSLSPDPSKGYMPKIDQEIINKIDAYIYKNIKDKG
jgi:AcrR family transcriptional regulator